MGADKNAPVRTRLCPKITIMDSTQACQGHVVTTDLPTLGTSLQRLRTKAEANMEEDRQKQGYQTPIG
jgi:hypothetical protein